MSEWKPIETAPKGIRILCFNPVVGIYTSQWQDCQIDESPEYQSDVEATNFPCGEWGGFLGKWFCAPTHWMELPEPPA